MAGRVVVRNGDKFEQKLVKLTEPILRVPSLCIHLQTAQERKALDVNKETHLTPILATFEEHLNTEAQAEGRNEAVGDRLPPVLLGAIAQDVGCDAKDIVDFELTLFDTQAAVIGGVQQEFIFSPRVDNQSHAYTGLRALVDYSTGNELVRL